jgi:hypothetical protein
MGILFFCSVYFFRGDCFLDDFGFEMLVDIFLDDVLFDV